MEKLNQLIKGSLTLLTHLRFKYAGQDYVHDQGHQLKNKKKLDYRESNSVEKEQKQPENKNKGFAVTSVKKVLKVLHQCKSYHSTVKLAVRASLT